MADTAGKAQLGPDQNPTRTRKLFSSFIFKPVMAVLFLVLVPVLTSHPPEFIVGQSAPARSWEILHILLVGIAVSYGLFSKRNTAAEAEDKEREKNGNAGKFENTQSYVNRFLQLSSLFDDESDGGGGGSSPCGSDVVRIQSMAWNSQYFRNEPMSIVDDDRNIGDSSAARISNKPLLLPVRSLLSRVPDDPREESVVPGVSPASLSRSDSTRLRSHDSGEFGVLAASFRRSSSNPGSISRRFPNGGSNTWSDSGESGVLTGSFSRSGSNPGSNSKRAPNGGSNPRSGNGRVSDPGYPESEANAKDSVVLPSPIPWRSRSGRMMDAREGVDSVYTFEIDDHGQSRPQVSWPSSMALSTPSLNRLSPSSFLSSVSPEAKIVTDSVKKKSSSHKAHIPAPPPPPPATTFRFPVEKNQSVPPPVNNGNNSSVYRDVNGNHPKSVRTIQASAKTVRKNALKENFFDGVLENVEQRQEFVKRMIIESDDEETDNDDDDDFDDNGVADEEDPGVPKDGRALPSNEVVEVVSHGASDGGPDVDKKADEFIAKFREQIRLQRIESIKRSSAEISKNSAR